MGIWALGIGALSVVVLGWGIYNEHNNEFPIEISSNYVWGVGQKRFHVEVLTFITHRYQHSDIVPLLEVRPHVYAKA